MSGRIKQKGRVEIGPLCPLGSIYEYNTSNTFFSNIVRKRDISLWKYQTVYNSNICHPLSKAIAKYKNHRGIRLMKNNFNSE